MTKQDLLYALCDFTRDVVKDLLLPVEMQEDDEKQPDPRPPEVFDNGLQDFTEVDKKSPFIIHQVIKASDVWPEGASEPVSKAVVRTVFDIYHFNSQDGQGALLGLIERLRMALWRQRVIGRQFKLDMKAGTDYFIYDKQLPPFYIGEMITTWKLPPVEREVHYGKQGYSNIRQSGPGGHICGGGHYGPQE